MKYALLLSIAVLPLHQFTVDDETVSLLSENKVLQEQVESLQRDNDELWEQLKDSQKWEEYYRTKYNAASRTMYILENRIERLQEQVEALDGTP